VDFTSTVYEIGIAPDGSDVRRLGAPFQSGVTPSSQDIDDYLRQSELVQMPRSGLYAATSHVETKLAWNMRQTGVKHAEIVINNKAGVCTSDFSCQVAVGAILPKGSSLTVWYRGEGGKLEGRTILGRA